MATLAVCATFLVTEMMARHSLGHEEARAATATSAPRRSPLARITAAGNAASALVVHIHMHEVALGLDTFGDITIRPDGTRSSDAQTIRDIVDEAVRADEVVLSFFGVGEHHRHEFAVSSPELVLAAAAARTEKIRLGTAVTVLSSDDPVRVYERFATLDALSNGRAEVILGRGSFTESFPLFGFDLAGHIGKFIRCCCFIAVALQQNGQFVPYQWFIFNNQYGARLAGRLKWLMHYNELPYGME